MSDLEIQAQQPQLILRNNSVFIQLLGLSPVLAVSSTVTYGLGLGAATFLVSVLSCLTASAVKQFISQKWRLIWFMVILASYTTVVEAISQIYFYPLFLRLGIYIPLICCNVALLLRMETVALQRHWIIAALDAFKTGFGFLLAIVFVSLCREFLVSGSLLYNWQILVPSNGAFVAPSQSAPGQFFQFANTQAGVLILLGLLIALMNFISGLIPGHTDVKSGSVEPAKRARVTGRLVREDSKESS